MSPEKSVGSIEDPRTRQRENKLSWHQITSGVAATNVPHEASNEGIELLPFNSLPMKTIPVIVNCNYRYYYLYLFAVLVVDASVLGKMVQILAKERGIYIVTT
jgi:hypothetical protein